MTLYNSYDEYNIDMDILGKVVSIPQLSRDELKEVVFKELQETHPIPKLEDERYKLSRLVDEDYQIQVENYAKEFEDEDISVDDLGEDEDPYLMGTDEEDLYSIGDVYGLDLNIFSSPFTEDEVNQAVSDIKNFLSQKVKKFNQDKAEYEKRNELSVEEVRALFQKRVSTDEEEEYTEDEEMIDTESNSEDDYTEDEEMVYIESSSTAEEYEGTIEEEVEEISSRVQEQREVLYFIQEPDIPFVMVRDFILEPDIPYVQVETTENKGIGVEEKRDTSEIVVAESVKVAEFFVEEADIHFISVTNSEELDSSDDVYPQESDEETVNYQEEEYDTYDEDEETDGFEVEDGTLDLYDSSSESEEGIVFDEEEDDSFDLDDEEDADFNEEEDEDDDSFDQEDDSSEEEGNDFDSEEEEGDSFDSDEEVDSFDSDEEVDSFDSDGEGDSSYLDSEEEEGEGEDGIFDSDDDDDSFEPEVEVEGFDSEEEDVIFNMDSSDTFDSEIVGMVTEPEPVLAPPPQVKECIIESKGSDTLNPRPVSKGSDLEGSFIDKPLASDTKLTRKSTEGREITNIPRDLVDFLRLYPRTQYKVAVEHYGEKEVKRQIRMGRVYKNGKYLVI